MIIIASGGGDDDDEDDGGEDDHDGDDDDDDHDDLASGTRGPWIQFPQLIQYPRLLIQDGGRCDHEGNTKHAAACYRVLMHLAVQRSVLVFTLPLPNLTSSSEIGRAADVVLDE